MASRIRTRKLAVTAAVVAAGITFSIPAYAVADQVGKWGQVTVAGYTWSN